jgi:hypothetical protein
VGAALLCFSIAVWAALTLWIFTTDVVSAATLIPLAVLASGFEALYALDAGIGPGALFVGVFLIAAAVNYLPAAFSGTGPELAGLAIAHGLFAVRLLVARRRAARRHHDLDRDRTFLSSQEASRPSGHDPFTNNAPPP